MPSPEQQSGSRGRSPFTISGSAAVGDNFVVHFHKRSHSLSLEIYAALERPTSVHTAMFRASSHRHPKLKVGFCAGGRNVWSVTDGMVGCKG